MRLIHLTDPHLSSLKRQSLRSISGKRLSGYLSWTFKRQFQYRRETLDLLTAAVRAEAADQLILSGDLVQIGLEQEIHQVAGWLADLAPPEQIFFVPGNHDVYTRDSWPAIRQHWNFVLPERFEGASDSSRAAYPFTRDLGGLRLIGASSACVTRVFSSRGALGQDQLRRLDAELQEARDLGYLPCLVIHHPPLPDLCSGSKALKEDESLRTVIAERQPALVCFGHLHRNMEISEGAARVFCTASASSAKKASFRIFDIEQAGHGQDAGWTVRMRLKSIASGQTHFALADEKRWTFTL